MFRKSLLLACAAAPLLCALPASAATVDGSRNTPIATSTADGGPGDVTITANGSITGVGTTPAVALDSSNSVSNAGNIQIEDVSGSTGVLIQGGNTGGFNNTGTISLVENFTPPDSNQDGSLEAPYAQGASRYGVRLVGGAPFVGDLVHSGAITIEGNDSAAFSIEAPLQGSLVDGGTISVTGDRSKGISITGPVAGLARVNNSISVLGTDSTAIDIGANVAGSLAIYAPVTATGYGLSARPTIEDTLKKVQAAGSELQQSAAAIHIGGDLGQGLFIGAPPPGTTTDSTGDADGDGLADNTVGTGLVTSYGSAPAVLIGAADRAVNLGVFGAGENAYGVVVRGSVTGSGVYDGYSATAMQIGGLGGTAALAGGMRIYGAVTAGAYEASATGLRLGAGASVPTLRVEGTLGASILHSTLGSSVPDATATALLIEPGASLTTISNLGFITASVTDDAASASAVVDQSGSIATVVNQGHILATLTASTAGATPTGRAIALDLRANTTGVNLSQSINPSPVTLADGTLTTSTPSIVGDILLGSGPNTVTLTGGIITGALDMGSGPSSLTIDGGAGYQGALKHSGGLLDISILSGQLADTNPMPIQLRSLSLGATGVISFAVDPRAGTAGGFQVSGAANLADGAKIGVSLQSILTRPTSFTLVSAGALTVGGSGPTLVADTPFVVVAGLRTDTAAGTITLDLRQRTAAEIGFRGGEGAAYDAVYDSLGGDAAIQSALLGQTTQDGFLGLYRQMLPDYAGGVFRLARAGTEANARAAADSVAPAGSLWVQETAYGVDSKDDSAAPFRGAGIGFVAGLEGPDTFFGRFGATLSFLTGGIRNPDLAGDEHQSYTEFEAGLNWRAEAGGLKLDGRISGGLVDYSNRREFLQTDSTGTTLIDLKNQGDSKGYALSGRLGASYVVGGPRFSVRPQVHVDWFRLRQNGYTETGGGDGFDLTLGDRTGSTTSLTGSVVFIGGLGSDHSLQPSLELGYRKGLSGSPGVTTAQFGSGPAFELEPLATQQGTGVVRLGLTSTRPYFDIAFTAGAEARSDYLEGDLQLRARISF